MAPDEAPPERIHAQFLTSAPRLADCPAPSGPEVALAGRSNAGKSSVLNQLTGDKRLARTSKTPGRTRMLNFFTTRGGGLLVDLPGYGYAKAGKREQQAWQRSVEQYLTERLALAGVVLVMDLRHPFEPFDRQVIDWARRAGLRLHVLLNKADKLKHGARGERLRQARQRLGDDPRHSIQLFSASSGLGREEAIELLLDWLGGSGDGREERSQL